MPLKNYWAYVFTFDEPIETLLSNFNEAGPWQWELRESSWYGDYLNVRPVTGVRVRIHEFPQANEGGVFVGPGIVEGFRYDKGYTALLEIEAESPATKAEINEVFQSLLSKISAQNIKEIEPYD